jgi:hypothetical protein
MPTRKKSYKHIMLSSQHRNTNGSKLCSFTCYAIASVVEAVRPSLHKAVSAERRRTNLFLCHLLPVGQWQSLPAVWSYRIILNEKTEDPVLKPPQSLRSKCPMAVKKKLLIAATVSITGIEVHCCNQ